jgi:nucleotide sugar dehydrogenase
MRKLLIGFIGQGFVGKNFANDFEERGFDVTRYSLEAEYIGNKEKIKDCDIVFIAVPTPTTPKGFDDSIMRNEIKLVGQGKIAVIKSTILPGTTESIQKENPDIFILHSPEFLVAATAAQDTKHPARNLIGVPQSTPEYNSKAETVLSVLPEAPYSRILLSKETELIKYVGNNFLYTKVIFMNLMYDLAEKIGADWDKVSEAVSNDSRIGKTHMHPVHASLSGHTQPGRGAGGHCFPKDFEAFLQFYRDHLDDTQGLHVLEALRDKNIELLTISGKDTDILEGVYNIKNAQK